jgi:hypothetical protein
MTMCKDDIYMKTTYDKNGYLQYTVLRTEKSRLEMFIIAYCFFLLDFVG